MSNRIDIANNKSLKLTNVLTRRMDVDKAESPHIAVEQMISFLKTKGAVPIGPLIQKTSYSIREDGTVTVDICLMQQADTFISKTAPPIRWSR